MTQEALKLALDALIWTTGSGDFGEGGYAHEGAKKCLFPAITAIKKALAQPEQVMQDSTCSTTLRLQGKPYPRTCKKCGFGPCIAQPAAQLEQLHASEDVSIGVDVTEDGAHVTALRSYRNGAKVVFYSQFHSAPQRTWVGLEGEEIRNSWEEATKPDRSTMTMVTSFARAIEAKLKEKNT